MPIYAYRCTACGHAKDVLQKLSDPLLSTCPSCGADAFEKQVTAAGFQLKGSGWYATDFKGGAAPAAAPAGDATAAKTADKPVDKPAEKAADKSDSTASGTTGESKPAAAGGCGAGCACH